MAALLKWANATVTVCHSRTKHLEEVCKNADVIVAAVGKGALVKASWVKPGAVVIDCGINPIPDSTKKSGLVLFRFNNIWTVGTVCPLNPEKVTD